MKTIKVEKVHSKKIEYEKNGEARSFIKYAALCKDKWYEIKGRGNDRVKEGDVITGEYAEQDWESNGKSGTNYTLQLLEPIIISIIKRIEDLETAGGTANTETTTDDDGMPF